MTSDVSKCYSDSYIYGSPMYISLSMSASACQALKGSYMPSSYNPLPNAVNLENL